MLRKSCLLLAVAFALLLAAPAVAAPGPAAPVAVGGSGLFQQAWGWIMSVWSDHRGCIDPNGGDAVCAPLEAEPKHGPCIDPDGGDLACTQEKHRAGIDPNGGNDPASPSTYFLKARYGINPDGSTVCVP